MDEQITGKRFLAVTVLNVLITVVEIIGGASFRESRPTIRCLP